MNPNNSGEIPDNYHELLIRIDERTKHFTNSIDSIKESMVTQGEFKPVRMITYGLVGVMTTAIVLAIVGTVIGK